MQYIDYFISERRNNMKHSLEQIAIIGLGKFGMTVAKAHLIMTVMF